MQTAEASIEFHVEEVEVELTNEEALQEWLKGAISKEEKVLGQLNYIFCNDDYLHALNVEFLDHDTYTDIITFPSSQENISGDIFISIDRVRENADIYKVDFQNELHRVIIHGVLHLCGFGDKSPKEQATMREKENFYLKLISAK